MRNGQRLLELILLHPEIPQNTGNIGRLCSFVGNVRLHLIHPLGFRIDEKAIRRSGMDYWNQLSKDGNIVEHSSWQAFKISPLKPSRIWCYSADKSLPSRTLWEANYTHGDGLLFGKESSGIPIDVLEEFPNTIVRIPSIASDQARSLNLSTSVGIATYEALRQIQYLNNG